MSTIDRKLVTIREISEILPIENADSIELAIVDGWQVVVKKGEFEVGSKIVYFEIDSFLPVVDEFEFLRKSSFKSHPQLGEGFRVRTIKLRGQISQGLVLPISMFNIDISFELNVMRECGHKEQDCNDLVKRKIETYLTSILDVKKWEPPTSGQVISGNAKGNFPSFIQKTDQERIQNCFQRIKNYHSKLYEATLKLDGSSMTVFIDSDGNLGVCSRNLELKLDDESSTFVRVAKESGLLDALTNYFEYTGMAIAVQGELMGEGIQKNREKIKGHKFFVYDIFDISKQEYLSTVQRRNLYKELKEFYGADKIEHVPYISLVNVDEFESVKDFLSYANRKSIIHNIAEGVVFKNLDNPNISFKVINNDYLLKCED